MDSLDLDRAASQQLFNDEANTESTSLVVNHESDETSLNQDMEMSQASSDIQEQEDLDDDDDDEFIPSADVDDKDDDFEMDLDADQTSNVSEIFEEYDDSDDDFEESSKKTKSKKKTTVSGNRQGSISKFSINEAIVSISRRSRPPPSQNIIIPRKTGAESRIKIERKRSSAKMFRWETMWGKNVETIRLGLKMVNTHLKEISVPSHANLYPSAFYKISEERLANERFNYDTTHQTQTVLNDSKLAENYLASNLQHKFEIYLGPIKRDGPPQQLYTIETTQCIPLSQENMFPLKNGFILNVGGEIAALDWAPRRPLGNQYVAISTMSKHEKKNNTGGPPAFSRLTSRACIQFWKCVTDDLKQRIVSMSLPLVYCFEWGAAVKLVWRPGILQLGSGNELGLLLAVFEDGKARVFHVTETESTSCIYARLDKPLYEMYLKDTIITCATWIDGNIVVAGCANGMVAGWDLNYLTSENAHLPIFYHNLHQTYINTIITLYPTLPYHVSAVSYDGCFSVHDIRNPEHSVVFNQRSRSAVFTPQVIWMDRIQSIIYSDEPNTIKSWAIRKVDSGSVVSDGIGEVMATSSGGGGYHGFLLLGTKDGKARLTNVLRKVMAPKGAHYEQVWFKLEYAKKTGAFRIIEGFLVEKYKASRIQPPTTTIYEDKSDITAVSWNPNRIFGTWAAIGMGCGLVRVEDICADIDELAPAEGDVFGTL